MTSNSLLSMITLTSSLICSKSAGTLDKSKLELSLVVVIVTVALVVAGVVESCVKFSVPEVIRMSRALKCCCVCCWCGDCESCKQEIIIESPPGTIIGSVNHEQIRCRMRYTLRDANRTNVMSVIGPQCICDGDCSCCCDNKFAIYGTDGFTKIGGIRKKYAGFISEAFTTADSFTLDGKYIIWQSMTLLYIIKYRIEDEV
ncbi:unnamed protein product [Rotaria sp. Silwood2]|nr:unnamed protein product [Rotaria sp. Silwood2]CAF3169281.1 unnamed protein product [Rotaria sp. Silwood2]